MFEFHFNTTEKKDKEKKQIFTQDFYPTPKEVIEKMLEDTDVNDKFILDPSAGSGNIIDYCKGKFAKNCYAYEILPTLRKILESKCQIIGEDFLVARTEEISHINLIVMNPPFSEEEDHILHAWNIAPDGCEIISLCNSSIILNAHTQKQNQITSLIKDNGSFENLGNVFKNAERQTNVEIGLIKLKKPFNENDHEFDNYFSYDEDVEDIPTEAGLVTYDFVRDCVNRYVEAVKLYDSAMEMNKKINDLTKLVGGGSIEFGAKWKHNEHGEITREVFKKELQKTSWYWLFEKFDMNDYVTQGVKKDLNKFIEQQSNVPFTMTNIYKMIELIIGTHESRMKQVICEAFDLICSFSNENHTGGETWKTNSNYMINKKFIVPYIIEMVPYHDSIGMNYFSYNGEKIEDIRKALNYITGKITKKQKNKSEQIEKNEKEDDFSTGLSKLLSNKKILPGEIFNWCHFKCKGFKKGTMHFEFLDENTWAKFNIEVAKIRGWHLPEKITKQKNNFKKP